MISKIIISIVYVCKFASHNNTVNQYFPNIKNILSNIVIDDVKLPFSNSIANLSDGLLIINDIYIESIEKLPESFYMIGN